MISNSKRELMAHERIVFGVKGHVIGFHNNSTNDCLRDSGNGSRESIDSRLEKFLDGLTDAGQWAHVLSSSGI